MANGFPDSMLNSPDVNEMIRKVLSTLTPRQEKVLRMVLGIGERRKYSPREIATAFSVSVQRVYQIKSQALRRLKQRTYQQEKLRDDSIPLKPKERLTAPAHLVDIIETVSHLSPHLIHHLKVNPADLQKLPWNVFEHLVAEFFASWGYDDVRLVGRDQTTAADIFAVQRIDPSGVRIRYFVEVKRTKSKIGVEVVNGVLGAMIRERPVHGWHVAMIVSLTGFKEFKATDPVRLTLQGIELRDGNDVLNWLKNYRPGDRGLWLSEPLRHL